MRYVNTAGLRSSACSVAAVVVISLIAWSFEAYRDYLWRANGPGATIQAQAMQSSDARHV
jgi:hypothetical protein